MKDLWVLGKFGPMLLNEEKKPFNSEEYLYEIKFDGIRCLCFANKKSVKLISRNGKDITYLFPELNSIKNLVSKNVIFDGEIVSLEKGKPSFSKLSERLHLKNKKSILNESLENSVFYVVFDILYEGENLTNKELIERKNILDKYKENEVFIKSYVFNDGIKLFNSVKKLKLEGIVAKLKTGKYHINTRTSDFIKIKNVHEEIFYICGYIIKEVSYVFSLLLCEKVNGKFKYVGKVNVSKKDIIYEKIIKEKSIKCNFEESVKNAVYVRPKFKCNIEYLEKTKSGNLRHPVFKGVIM